MAMAEQNKPVKEQLWLPLGVITTAALLTYLPHVFHLGLYFDDWYILWTGFTDGARRLIEVQSLDRPVQGWLFALTYQMIGIDPLRWQLWQLFLRWVSALAAFWALRRLAPGETRFSLGGGLLFLLYPGFTSWPAAVTMQTLTVAMLCGVVSFAAALEALEHSKLLARFFWWGLSFLGGLACFFLFEWMISFAVITLLLLAVQIIRKQGGASHFSGPLFKKILLNWLPSALAALIFLYWRVFVFVNLRAATSLDGLKAAYLQQPLQMGLRLGVELVKDLLETLLLVWGVPFYHAWGTLTTGEMITALLVGLLLGGAVYGVWRKLEPAGKFAHWQALAWCGLGIVVAGMFIPVFANRDFRFDTILDRYSLAAMFGVVLLFAALSVRRGGVWLLVALVALSGMSQTATAFKFRAGWAAQRNLWQQIAWRAPRLSEGAVLMPLLPDDLRLQDDYEIWAPANLIYNRGNSTPFVTAEILNTATLPKLAAGIQEERNMRTLYFVRDFSRALVISYPNPAACIRVLDGQNPEWSLADDGLIMAAGQYSRPRDLIENGASPALPAEIFGAEAERTWCYFYQKAELARQTADWPAIARLGDEAQAQGLAPVETLEWLPFAEAYLELGREADASVLLEQMKSNQDALLWLCQDAIRAEQHLDASPADADVQRRSELCRHLMGD